MGVLERNRRYKQKKQQEPSPMPVAPTAQQEIEDPLPASGDVNTPDAVPVQPAPSNPTAPAAETRPVSEAPNAMVKPEENHTGFGTGPDLSISPGLVDNTPSWVKAGSYEELVKTNPNVSRAQYAYELGKYRREQGLPDLSYQEWANIIKNRNPYETETERQKRERNLRVAQRINALGSFINALVNYNRVKRGHVGYTPDKGTEGYNRIERIRQGQEQLGRSYAKDYMGAIAQDRAERAKEAAAAAAAAQRERDYRLKEAELKVKIENARSERERKAAADELARMKFKHQQETDAAKLKETQRHNQAQEAVSWHRAKNGGGSNKYLELETSEGKKRYTPNEYGTNWVHKAYQDMLKEPDGKKFAVNKAGGMFGSGTPSEQEMYEAITKYNESQWKNRYKSERYKGGKTEKPPLE